MDNALSIVIVNWNGGALLRRCLESIAQAPPGVPFEVLVVDNASTDASVAWLRSDEAQRSLGPGRLTIIENGANLGFSKANNVGFAARRTPFVFLLNADTEVRPGAIDALLATAGSDPRIGLVGPRVTNPDGTLQPNVARNPLTPWEILLVGLRLHRLLPSRLRGELLLKNHWPHARRRDVPFISGTAMLVRREVIDRVGGLDERFHMYSEDIEWCHRIGRAGWRLVFEPDAVIMHHGHAFSLQRWGSTEKLRVALEALVLGWEISLPRWHAAANSLASCLLLGIALAKRRVSGQPPGEVPMMLEVHRDFLKRCVSRLPDRRRDGLPTHP